MQQFVLYHWVQGWPHDQLWYLWTCFAATVPVTVVDVILTGGGLVIVSRTIKKECWLPSDSECPLNLAKGEIGSSSELVLLKGRVGQLYTGESAVKPHAGGTESDIMDASLLFHDSHT